MCTNLLSNVNISRGSRSPGVRPVKNVDCCFVATTQTHIAITNTKLAVGSFEYVKATSYLYHPVITEPATENSHLIAILPNAY